MKNASRRRYHFTYKTVCTVSNSYYFGIHSTDDMNDGYLGSGRRLVRSVKLHGKASHRREVIAYFPDRKSLIEAEEHLITTSMLADKACMNMIPGGHVSSGMTGRKHSEETKKKMSESTKGQVCSDATRAKISASRSGITPVFKNPEERQRKITAALTKTRSPKPDPAICKCGCGSPTNVWWRPANASQGWVAGWKVNEHCLGHNGPWNKGHVRFPFPFISSDQAIKRLFKI